ncbi:ribosomal protein acetylating enzyme [Philodulcilactobacillus myokoensis]|uniref:Ribosomal protein acetylating enzyme n=1 Tax=Philodulcilactobacillus myokoensis TaxID=2929573 RepID=A0A9W6EU12_9LACO|nr:GNAT family protein [Philodulcilactobacillus myokoensis]GLB47543.1 ribosomal protein acetylating enzyme [Philodulcilactobacillus myokoensis]
MLSLCQFNLSNHHIKIEFPEMSHAHVLYEEIAKDRNELQRFLPWANFMKSEQDEMDFLEQCRGDIAKGKGFPFVILCDGTPAGMIDLHNINYNNSKAEVGYWLFSGFQGMGIVTQSLKMMIQNIQEELHFHKYVVLADVKNKASQNIPLRLGFKYEATLKDYLYHHNRFHDLNAFIKLF